MKIGIIGLGLIGGSIFKSLSSQGIDVIGISNSQAGKYDNIFADWNNLSNCDLVFGCSPMNKLIEDQLKKVTCADLSNFNKETNIYLIPKKRDIKIKIVTNPE